MLRNAPSVPLRGIKCALSSGDAAEAEAAELLETVQRFAKSR